MSQDRVKERGCLGCEVVTKVGLGIVKGIGQVWRKVAGFRLVRCNRCCRRAYRTRARRDAKYEHKSADD